MAFSDGAEIRQSLIFEWPTFYPHLALFSAPACA